MCRIECSQCGKWRIISYAKMNEAKDADWVCRLLRCSKLFLELLSAGLHLE